MTGKRVIALAFCCFQLTVHAATNAALTDDQLAKIEFDQKLGSQVSPALTFTDETGNVVRMDGYFGKKPSVLILGYYGCPMLCTLVLNGAADCFRNMNWKAGPQFNVIFVSIDSAETSSLANKKKQSYVHGYGSTAANWHFLTGDRGSVSNLADEIGFRYAYDAPAKQFAHPSGIVILTPEGKVARYFFGINFAAKDVDSALRDAAVDKAGAPEPQFYLLCFHYAPVHGKYGKLVMTIVRGGGILTIVVMTGVLLMPASRNKTGPTK